ncbi:MAG: hypothetical protein PHF86_12030 [Candidatus Nanoarchaeia archaeon]|nr:hypothetical protein [Candidatus Nanoarchaeia archaeon]
MSKIKSYFIDVSKVLEAQSKLSSNIHHKGLIGQNRELFIQNFIIKSFPKKFVIGTGEIIDSEDKLSKQADIVIYDEFMPSFDYGSSKHFLSSGVLAHIEVKSNLTSNELKKALDITKSIKVLNRDIDASMHFGRLPKKLSSFIFAYEGISKETFKQKMQEYYHNEEDIDNVIDAVCVLNKYVMVKTFDKDGKPTMAFFDTEEDSLMAFFGRLFDAMHKNWAGTPNIYKYLGDLKFKQF